MPVTYIPIQSVALTSSQTSVTFSAIPQTFTDLVVDITARSSDLNSTNLAQFHLSFNGGPGGTSWSDRWLQNFEGTGFAGVATSVGRAELFTNAFTNQANSFSSSRIYIPNYRGSTVKPSFGESFAQQQTNTGRAFTLHSLLWNSTSAITSVVLTMRVISGNPYNFAAGSNFHLYGISNT